MFEDYLSRKDEMEGAGYHRNAMLLRDSDIMAFAEKYLRRTRTSFRKYDERFSGTAATQVEINAYKNKVDSLKNQFYSIN